MATYLNSKISNLAKLPRLLFGYPRRVVKSAVRVLKSPTYQKGKSQKKKVGFINRNTTIERQAQRKVHERDSLCRSRTDHIFKLLDSNWSVWQGRHCEFAPVTSRPVDLFVGWRSEIHNSSVAGKETKHCLQGNEQN